MFGEDCSCTKYMLSVAKAQRHEFKLVQSKLSPKSGAWYMFSMHLNLVVINFAPELRSHHSINDLFDPWKVLLVLLRYFVDGTVVDTKTLRSRFLL